MPPLDLAPAVELFVQRAQAVDAGFVLTAHNQPILEAICQRLDCLPLAIELAATRSHLLTPAEMTERMRGSVAVVATRDPTVPDRQRSLDRLLDWSLDLLGPDERRVLTRLAVLVDGFDVSLAEEVAGDDTLPVARVPELVWSLIDWSLVGREAAAGSSRYTLPSTVRSYVLQCADEEELAAARLRLADALMDRVGPARTMSGRWVTQLGIDLEVPGVGEIIGSGIREQTVKGLKDGLKEQGISDKEYGAYFDTREYGFSFTSGMGLGIGRLMTWLLDEESIRKVTEYPRFPGYAAP